MIYSTNILSLKADLLKGANNSFTISTKIRCYNCHEIPQFPLESLPPIPLTYLRKPQPFERPICLTETCVLKSFARASSVLYDFHYDVTNTLMTSYYDVITLIMT